MMYIDGHWETVNGLKDISKIIREYYNEELADEMDRLLASTRISDYELERLDELEMVMQQIRDLVF